MILDCFTYNEVDTSCNRCVEMYDYSSSDGFIFCSDTNDESFEQRLLEVFDPQPETYSALSLTSLCLQVITGWIPENEKEAVNGFLKSYQRALSNPSKFHNFFNSYPHLPLKIQLQPVEEEVDLLLSPLFLQKETDE